VTSRVLQSLATPIVAFLVASAATLGGALQNAISYCNVLFVGNLCAAAVVLASFGPRKIYSELQRLGRRLWMEAVLFGALSALLSSMIFVALESTSVTNVVLLARLGPVLYAVGGALLLGFAITRHEWFGFGLIGLGVMATAFVAGGFEVAQGDLLILMSAVVYAAVTMMGKRLSSKTGLGALLFVRNALSAIVFFFVAIIFFGPDHFAEAFTGPLWAIMAIYALVVIVAAQFLWYRAISELTPASVAKWTVMTPAFAVGFAYVVNGEQPSAIQLTALGFIMAGIVVSSLGRRTPKGQPDSAEQSVAAS
jgi:drug/metabolite transporter (DMT)-like permease